MSYPIITVPAGLCAISLCCQWTLQARNWSCVKICTCLMSCVIWFYRRITCRIFKSVSAKFKWSIKQSFNLFLPKLRVVWWLLTSLSECWDLPNVGIKDPLCSVSHCRCSGLWLGLFRLPLMPWNVAVYSLCSWSEGLKGSQLPLEPWLDGLLGNSEVKNMTLTVLGSWRCWRDTWRGWSSWGQRSTTARWDAVLHWLYWLKRVRWNKRVHSYIMKEWSKQAVSLRDTGEICSLLENKQH